MARAPPPPGHPAGRDAVAGNGRSTGSPPKARSASPRCIADAGPQAWDDGGFGVHLAFFSRTPAETRIRILEGRRRTVEERREGLRTVLGRTGEQIDRYTRELHRLGLDSTEREVRWLNELIATERAEQSGDDPPPAGGPVQNHSGDVAGDGTSPSVHRNNEELGGT